MKKSIKKSKTLGWIGDIEWMTDPFPAIINGAHFSVLFKTRQDARCAGWSNPKRVEVTLRVL